MATSTSDAVGDLAAAGVQGIGIQALIPVPDREPRMGSVPVERRKTPSLPEGKSPPQFVVSVGTEQDSTRITNAHRMKRIRFAVTIVTGGGQASADDSLIRQWRDQIDAVIYDKQCSTFGSLSDGVNSFIEIKAFGGDVFDRAALSKDYNYSSLGYEAHVIVPTNL